jgi:hypothetical protein
VGSGLGAEDGADRGQSSRGAGAVDHSVEQLLHLRAAAEQEVATVLDLVDRKASLNPLRCCSSESRAKHRHALEIHRWQTEGWAEPCSSAVAGRGRQLFCAVVAAGAFAVAMYLLRNQHRREERHGEQPLRSWPWLAGRLRGSVAAGPLEPNGDRRC